MGTDEKRTTTTTTLPSSSSSSCSSTSAYLYYSAALGNEMPASLSPTYLSCSGRRRPPKRRLFFLYLPSSLAVPSPLFSGSLPPLLKPYSSSSVVVRHMWWAGWENRVCATKKNSFSKYPLSKMQHRNIPLQAKK